jgi:hypothetical protein
VGALRTLNQIFTKPGGSNERVPRGDLCGRTPRRHGGVSAAARRTPVVADLHGPPVAGAAATADVPDGVRQAHDGRRDEGDLRLEVRISKYPPAEPEALRLLAPQRGLFATA